MRNGELLTNVLLLLLVILLVVVCVGSVKNAM